MIQGGRALYSGLFGLAALCAAGVARAQTGSDLPQVDHTPFADVEARSDADQDEPPRLRANAHVNGVQVEFSGSPGFGGAWRLDMAGPRGGLRPPGFGPGGDPGGWPGPGGGPSILRDMPNGRADRGLAVPSVARYAVGAGEVFVLDRSAGSALLKFEGSPEIWALQPTPGPRGDVIYKNDMGEPILRATRLGGLTLFSSSAPGGAAAAMVGSADDLQPPPFLPPNAVFQHMLQASARASRAAQHLITFDAAEVTPDSAPVFVDAAAAAAEAVVSLSHRDDGKAFLRRLDKMQFQPGPKSGASMANGGEGGHVRMQVFVDPGQGSAGWPSSQRLVSTALNK